MISLSFQCGVKLVNTYEVPQNVKLSSTKSPRKVFSEKVGRDNGFQPELFEGEIEHSVKNKSNFANLGHIWELYLNLDVFCLAFIYARHSLEIQNMSGFGYKDCLTEGSLGWKCFGTYDKDR